MNMRYVNVDKLMRKIFDGDGDKPWFGSAGNDAKVLRFIDQFFYDDIDSKRLDKWIPVSERLPEIGVRVLCACQADLYDVLKLTPDGWFYDTRHTYMFGFVRAWQPLPEPYTEESEGMI